MSVRYTILMENAKKDLKFWMKREKDSVSVQVLARGIPELDVTYTDKEQAERDAAEFRSENARNLEQNKWWRRQRRAMLETFSIVEVNQVVDWGRM